MNGAGKYPMALYIVLAMAVACGLYSGSTSDSMMPVYIGIANPPTKNSTHNITYISPFDLIKGIGIPSKADTNSVHVENTIQF
jgi:hypothetical protein